jgi:hypothetical protein
MVLTPLTWKAWMKNRWALFLYKNMGVRCGPFMYTTWAGEWMLIDTRGRLWRLTYQKAVGWGESPIRVEKVREP